MDKVINAAKEYIEELFRGNSGGHDAEHTLRVYTLAMKIAETEPGCDRNIAALAALLHDADDHKLFETKDNENARRFLAEHNVDEFVTEHIINAVNSVSFSRNRGRRPESIEGCVVRDADRLDAMGAIGIARTFAYGGKNGRSLSDSIAHFHEKLLLLKDEMITETGRRIAADRHRFLEEFLSEYERESCCK